MAERPTPDRPPVVTRRRRPAPVVSPEEERERARQRADQLVESGMPHQMALAVAYGRLSLNEALERLARRDKVERLMREHDLSRALATQVALGHADLEQVLSRRRFAAHRDAFRDHSVLLQAIADSAPMVLALHGSRMVKGRITATDTYHVDVDVDGDSVREHKLQLKYAYKADDWKAVKKVLKVDKKVAADALAPIERPQDRYACSDKRLFRYSDQGREVQVTLLGGELLRGHVSWISRFEFGLRVKGDAEVAIFRHALVDLQAV